MGMDQMRELAAQEIGNVDGGVYILNLNYGGFSRNPFLAFLGIGNTAIAVNFGRGGSSFYSRPTLNIDNVNVINVTQEIHQPV
ncbi:hypothetical protein FUT69_09525 [Xylella taiwanensis]|nr:hypothetical protein [Xylella taiwanensis]QKD99487.1 hypothetical protein PLS229_03220 [Xylella taiwanensis]